MKAAILEGLHKPLIVQEIPTPAPAAGQALVRIKAAALNHRDVWIQGGLYPGLRFPVQLGSDGAGVVEAVGDTSDTTWVGKEVIINPSLNWGPNHRFYSREFKILGMPDPGTFAEYITISTDYLVEKPSHLSFEEAAAIPLAGLTAWRSLMTRGQFLAGQKVLVTGIGGGVALFAMQFALAGGASEVWVTSGHADKIERAVALGAKGGVSYKEPKWEKDLIAQAGLFDVVIDSAGGDGFAKLIDVAAPGSNIVFYGGTLGNINGIIPAKVFFKQLNIMGSTMGTPEEFRQMIQLIERAQLKPVVDKVYWLEDAELAMRRMEAGQQFGKIVLKTGE
ncbi:MAG: zinc-binding dehydrogenase [Spirosomataceae bacterium]